VHLLCHHARSYELNCGSQAEELNTLDADENYHHENKDAEISGHGNRDNSVEEEEEQNAKAKETDALDASTEDYDHKNRDAERSGRRKRGRSE
jgi:hypothetical protein